METLAQLLKATAEKYPDKEALAIRCGEARESWSYRELYQFSWRVASYLWARGVDKGDRVVLWAPNQPEWVGVFLGCQLAGVAVVPLDARFTTASFLTKIEGQTEPKLLVTTKALALRLLTGVAPALLLVIGGVLVAFYPLTREAHRLASRRSEATAGIDPDEA